MTTLDYLFGPGPSLLEQQIAEGWIRRARSGDGLSIYNYTEKAQFDRHWNDATLACRGLIAEDETGRVVAWPFPKFFNYSEHGHGNPWAPDLPDDEDFTIWEKVDGSLGIVFWDRRQNRWRVASRGSFHSEQAQWAQGWIERLDAYGQPVTARLQPGNTYLAEIVYPRNRIVVNNGNREALVLLGIFDEFGNELSIGYSRNTLDWMAVGPVVRNYPHIPLGQLVGMAATNIAPDASKVTGTDAEGFVLRFDESGVRVKIKYSEYVRLHAVLTGMNERTVWEVLAEGGSLDELLENVPDEFMCWVREVEERLRREHDRYALAAHMAYKALMEKSFESRREFAAEAVPTSWSAALFRLYDGKSIDALAWKACRPSGTATFSSTEGE